MRALLLPDARGDRARPEKRRRHLNGIDPTRFLVPTSSPVPTSCIDGRLPTGRTLTDSAKWPGASPGIVLALTMLDEAPEAQVLLSTLGALAPLHAHSDSHDTGCGYRGCAAVSGAAGVQVPDLAPLAALGNLLDVPATRSSLRTPLPLPPGTPLPGVHRMILQGDHVEGAFLINLRRDTTLDTRALLAATDGRASAFCWDAWTIPALAESLSPALGLAEERLRLALLAWGIGVAHLLWAPDLPLDVLD